MNDRQFITTVAALLVGVGFLISGCASGVNVTNTLPDRLKESLQEIETDQGVNFEFTPIPAGEQFQVSVGAMDYSLNRVFQGMLIEMLEVKFDSLQAGARNSVRVQVEYLNVQEENYGGTLNRMDMAVTVGVNNGFNQIEEEIEFTEQAEMEGYGLQSGQIQNLLLRFTLEINDIIDQQYAQQGVSQTD